MNKLNFFIIITIGVTLVGCGQNSSKKSKTDKGKTLSQAVEKTDSVANDNLEDKFLITTNSVGFFKIGDSWQNFSKNDYKYESIQGHGSCTDACCDGGFVLGNKIVDSGYGKTIEIPEIIIGALSFDESTSEDKHKNNSKVFYASSDNCQGWYWKDRINYIVIYSDLFKTKEVVGVGTTLEEVLEKFGKLSFNVGWIEEDVNALQVVIKPYPNISFILEIDDYKGNWEDISLKKDKNSLTISDFKENTKIQRIILKRKS